MSQLSRSFYRYFSSMTTHTNVPALLIGEMARHVDYKGRGIGILIRDWVINKALEVSNSIGCRLFYK